MKRNQSTVILGRRRKANSMSRYAAKVASRNQMYGPGCCAHTRQTRHAVPGNPTGFGPRFDAARDTGFALQA